MHISVDLCRSAGVRLLQPDLHIFGPLGGQIPELVDLQELAKEFDNLADSWMLFVF